MSKSKQQQKDSSDVMLRADKAAKNGEACQKTRVFDNVHFYVASYKTKTS